MTTDENRTLRQRAEAALLLTRTEIESMSPEKIQKLVHDLQVHEIELKMQNEELRRAQLELAQSRDRFNDLFEFAPVGYLTLDSKGTILEANQTASTMLALPRRELLNRSLTRFITAGSQDALYRHRNEVFSSGDSHACELELLRADGSCLPVQMHCNRFTDPVSDTTRCRAVLLDTSARQRVEEQLKQSVRQLHGMTQRLVASQEVERHRISRELHDQIGQALTAIQLNLQAVLALPNHEELVGRVQDSLRLVDELAQQTQDMSLSLRPSLLDDLGLPAALRWLIDHQGSRAGLRAEFRAGPLEGRLDPAIETACFRVAQEALTNVIRHAQASRITMHLQPVGTELILTVEDDGHGFDVGAVRGAEGSAARLGLLGMEERVMLLGGRLEICSSGGQGTSVKAHFPLKWLARKPQHESDTR